MNPATIHTTGRKRFKAEKKIYPYSFALGAVMLSLSVEADLAERREGVKESGTGIQKAKNELHGAAFDPPAPHTATQREI